ncbi:hypothetical protein BB561_002311 [Smittium simulii]|uniref:RING-type domain-containing protein n=1 Tax=Smittium simulii TaxID=133385 RepID=A0A2T9YQW9_9FUNG|nr:hypothetical protein BB561_002311 [Smittium simulii]
MSSSETVVINVEESPQKRQRAGNQELDGIVTVVSSPELRTTMKTRSGLEDDSKVLAPVPPSTKRRAVFKCMVCLDRPVNSVLVRPCGHLFCEECILTAMQAAKKCPVCRQEISLKSLVSFQFRIRPNSQPEPLP